MYENKDEYKVDSDGYVIYTVPFFKSTNGIMSIVFGSLSLLLIIILLFSEGGDFRAFCIMIPFIGLMIYLTSAKNLSYVKLSKDYLIVKKRFYFFTKDIVYENSNILEITFEYIKWAERKGNNKIRITTKDLDTRSFTMDLYKRRTFYD